MSPCQKCLRLKWDHKEAKRKSRLPTEQVWFPAESTASRQGGGGQGVILDEERPGIMPPEFKAGGEGLERWLIE